MKLSDVILLGLRTMECFTVTDVDLEHMTINSKTLDVFRAENVHAHNGTVDFALGKENECSCRCVDQRATELEPE
jgi:hypothetical protein